MSNFIGICIVTPVYLNTYWCGNSVAFHLSTPVFMTVCIQFLDKHRSAQWMSISRTKNKRGYFFVATIVFYFKATCFTNAANIQFERDWFHFTRSQLCCFNSFFTCTFQTSNPTIYITLHAFKPPLYKRQQRVLFSSDRRPGINCDLGRELPCHYCARLERQWEMVMLNASLQQVQEKLLLMNSFWMLSNPKCKLLRKVIVLSFKSARQ